MKLEKETAISLHLRSFGWRD